MSFEIINKRIYFEKQTTIVYLEMTDGNWNMSGRGIALCKNEKKFNKKLSEKIACQHAKINALDGLIQDCKKHLKKYPVVAYEYKPAIEMLKKELKIYKKELNDIYKADGKP